MLTRLVSRALVSSLTTQARPPRWFTAQLPQHRYIMSFCGWDKGEVYKDHFDNGLYVCSKCENPLFKSAAKYKHSTPWPAFTEPITKESLKKYHETEMALKVLCGKCGQGLGHQFLCDGPTKGSSRF